MRRNRVFGFAHNITIASALTVEPRGVHVALAHATQVEQTNIYTPHIPYKCLYLISWHAPLFFLFRYTDSSVKGTILARNIDLMSFCISGWVTDVLLKKARHSNRCVKAREQDQSFHLLRFSSLSISAPHWLLGGPTGNWSRRIKCSFRFHSILALTGWLPLISKEWTEWRKMT